MSDGSGIEWTEATWPVVQGCTEVSPGCAHCYARNNVRRQEAHPNPKVSAPLAGGMTYYSRGGSLRWSGSVALRYDRLDWPLHWRKPKLIFVPSHGDLFHPDVPDGFIDRVFAVMALSPQHTYQVLTKRAERMRHYVVALMDRLQIGAASFLASHLEVAAGTGHGETPLANVQLGVSAENQRWADERIQPLLDTPAAVRFVSLEPLLGPIDLEHVSLGDAHWRDALRGWENWHLRRDGLPGTSLSGPDKRLSWVIAGGESGGPDKRRLTTRYFDPTAEHHTDVVPITSIKPEALAWVRSLRDQCAAAGVPFFFKQWGGPRAKSGGRLLDGRTWDEMPAVAAGV